MSIESVASVVAAVCQPPPRPAPGDTLLSVPEVPGPCAWRKVVSSGGSPVKPLLPKLESRVDIPPRNVCRRPGSPEPGFKLLRLRRYYVGVLVVSAS